MPTPVTDNKILEAIATLQAQLPALGRRAAATDETIASLQAQMADQRQQLGALATATTENITTLQGHVTTLQSQTMKMNHRIADQNTRVTTLGELGDSLERRLARLEQEVPITSVRPVPEQVQVTMRVNVTDPGKAMARARSLTDDGIDDVLDAVLTLVLEDTDSPSQHGWEILQHRAEKIRS